LFYHIHIVDGAMVIHSHFYNSESNDRTPIKNIRILAAHHIIFQLQELNADELIVTSPYKQPLRIEQVILRSIVNQTIDNSLQLSIPPRAPPIC